METITNELLGIVGAGVATVGLGILEALRRHLVARLARDTVLGAVERAAGLAMEAQRTGAEPGRALMLAEDYVKQAVPDALARVQAGPHLGKMIQGAVGVLRASQPIR